MSLGGRVLGSCATACCAVVQRLSGQLVPLPTAGDNPNGLFTAAAAEGATPMAPEFQPWITRIDPNYGLFASPGPDTLGVSLRFTPKAEISP